MSEVPRDVMMAAAALYVQARAGDKYEIVGCGESEEDGSIWEIDVREKDRPRTKTETILAPEDVLLKIIQDKLDIEHLTGKKPLPENIRAMIKDQFGDGFDDLFEDREL
jgi:hypothetical protein